MGIGEVIPDDALKQTVWQFELANGDYGLKAIVRAHDKLTSNLIMKETLNVL